MEVLIQQVYLEDSQVLLTQEEVEEELQQLDLGTATGGSAPSCRR
jgi:hypothetical protein